MHERFSDRARHAMALANQEASRLGHAELAPEHIMLGLIAEGACVATEALRVLAVDLNEVRDAVQQQLEQGKATNNFGSRSQSKETKQIIEMAIQEARKFGHRYVGTEHLVLALLVHEDNIPAKALTEKGVSISALREHVLGMLHSSVDSSHDLAHSRHGVFEWVHQQELAKAFRSPKFWHTMILAVDTANRLGAGEVEPEHLLLSLLRDGDTSVAKLLSDRGVTADWLRTQLVNGQDVATAKA